MDTERVIVRLSHIIEAIDRVRGVVLERTFQDYEADAELQWLVERGVEIISEATRHIPAAMTVRRPQISWSGIKAIGDQLQHEYDDVDPHVIWLVAIRDVEILRPVIIEMLDSLTPNPSES